MYLNLRFLFCLIFTWFSAFHGSSVYALESAPAKNYKTCKSLSDKLAFLSLKNVEKMNPASYDSILNIIQKDDDAYMEFYWHHQNIQFYNFFKRTKTDYDFSLSEMKRIAFENNFAVESTVARFRSTLANFGGKQISEEEMYFEYLSCFEQIKQYGISKFSLYGIDWILSEIGRNFYELNDYENALECLKIVEREVKERNLFYLLTLNLIEAIYSNKRDFPNAIIYAYKINQLDFNYPQDPKQLPWLKQYWTCLSFLDLADFNLELKRYKQAEFFLNKGISLLPVNKDFSVNHKVVAEFDALQVIIKVQLGLNKIDEAEPLLKRLELLKNNLGTGMPAFYFKPMKLYNNYKTFYEKKKDYLKAYYYLKLVDELKDSLNHRNDKRSLWLTEMRIKSERFLDEINHAEAESLFQKKLRNTALIGLILFLLFSLIVYIKIKTDNTIIKVQKLSLEESLLEKEILLKEVHHRVKNNLQIISGLLEKQAEKTNDALTKQLMKEGQDRVLSMALVHQNLYQSKNLSAIELKPYIEMLSRNISDSHSADDFRIKVDLKLQSIFVNIDTTIALGLILNELITNCYKYAFNGISSGKITICIFSNSKEITMTVEDNGIGLPSDFDINNRSTLGMSLIKGLVRQLNGKFEYHSVKNSTKFSVFCPI